MVKNNIKGQQVLEYIRENGLSNLNFGFGEVDLQDTLFQCVNFQETLFYRVDFKNASFESSDFRGADLEDTQFTKEQIEELMRRYLKREFR